MTAAITPAAVHKIRLIIYRFFFDLLLFIPRYPQWTKGTILSNRKLCPLSSDLKRANAALSPPA